MQVVGIVVVVVVVEAVIVIVISCATCAPPGESAATHIQATPLPDLAPWVIVLPPTSVSGLGMNMYICKFILPLSFY